ncbi:uncharacterized protein N7515_004436 [Penicillium bovifimosum]|uniref:FHA domain-containing protein n=1 Tax=Penicillium bovifimosum TaxID=126998 RepID=A0A9W9H1I8_9EURO|nr:uncharacterized protein N7515_004436 [Penicillium bovifimosum]KAJ5135158.1 hypothetical protein N7515_004436 [Penicillium bovifimosum]
MAGSYDDRRRRSPSDTTRESRRRDASHDDHGRSSRRRDESRRSSHRDSSRRRSSRSPSERTSRRSDRDRPRRERRERSTSSPRDDRRHRHRSHRHRDSRREDEGRSSRRHRSARSRSRSPRKSRSPPPQALERRGPLPSQSDAFTDVARPGDEPVPEKQKPNFNPSGRLAAESNTVQVQGGAIVLKYHEPPEARKPPPKEAWRMYVFKGEDLLETVELSERSCWLVGRERTVVDFPLDHPSCSKQHAVLQFRFVEKRNEYGDRIGKVKPYLIDLESANGSSVNGEAIPGGRYVEVMDKDVIRFGLSSREYVLMLPPPS